MNPDVRALFAGPNYAHVATVSQAGAPHSTPVWIDVEGDDLVFLKAADSVAARNLRADPRVAISIHNTDNPYECAQVRGRVREIRDGAAPAEWLDRVAVKYTGAPYPSKLTEPSILVVVEIGRGSYLNYTEVQHRPPVDSSIADGAAQTEL
ncbi:TIGR03618 family F420-dependent PPOX class oxidoreductase [Gordonia sp. SID5947]|uniref:PPOX class F420-dependent oxidoreductase n=1 Tax=Gordonia sp. SID5947 TaxID=2690315 RepID=UPI001368F8FD|nr:PPOX class F420-dependent oxidoreductase [Gordonia sp. SID5947]MYR07978.1 TIGR03618 family F420-dependent PPOX class oxidoreductase [Gordonia sp. SID5947]